MTCARRMLASPDGKQLVRVGKNGDCQLVGRSVVEQPRSTVEPNGATRPYKVGLQMWLVAKHQCNRFMHVQDGLCLTPATLMVRPVLL